MAVALVLCAPAYAQRFVQEGPAADIYHAGWIDLNKNGVTDVYEDPGAPVEKRVENLLSLMNSDEKTAQMATLYGYPRVLKDELPTPGWKSAAWKEGIGNIDEQSNGNEGNQRELADPQYDLPWSLHARQLNQVQRFFIEETRLGIPVDFTNEGIRGLLHSKATSFPCQLGVASAWDKELVLRIGEVTGREARALGYTNVYSPICDLPRDPRWGRTPECYSEDPFLTGTLVVQQVRGIQSQKVVSTLKHFAVYSVPQGGRDGDARTNPQVTWREAQMVFLQPFKRAVREGGALGVMASYNDYDGIPIEANPLFLTDILRKEWGFGGYVVSDSGAVEMVSTKHRVAATAEEAIRQSVEAGLNVRTNFTPPERYLEPLRRLVADGRLPMATIDSRVRDILRVKFWLGLFDQPYREEPGDADKIVRASEHLAIAARAARESIILLKNEGNVLPLKKDLRKVLVAGPLGNSERAWWTRYGPQRLDFVTILEGIRAKLPGAEVKYVEGVGVVDSQFPASDVYKEAPDEKTRAGIAEAVAAAQDVDVIIAALGEDDAICRESASRISLNLPGYQEELLKALQATGKPVVLVLTNGRPLSVNWAAAHVPAIVEGWFPGEEGGAAIADVLFGDSNPSGRLPVTIPRSVGQIPLAFPVHPGANGRDGGQVTGPLFPFGFGLSYTTFEYGNLKITPEKQARAGRVEVHCDVTNSGQRGGDEVVQLYVRDDYASVITFEKELKGFERVHLEPGEKKTVTFTLGQEELEVYGRANQWVVEPGSFTVMVGGSSDASKLQGRFEITEDAK
jgi:beta-glucosidase